MVRVLRLRSDGGRPAAQLYPHTQAVYREASLIHCGTGKYKAGDRVDLVGAKYLSYSGKWSGAEYTDVRLCGPPLSGRMPLWLSAATLVDDDTLYHPADPLRTWLDHHFRLGVEHVTVCTMHQ